MCIICLTVQGTSVGLYLFSLMLQYMVTDQENQCGYMRLHLVINKLIICCVYEFVLIWWGPSLKTPFIPYRHPEVLFISI